MIDESIIRKSVVVSVTCSSSGNSRSLCCFAGANAKLRYQITAGNTGGVFDVEPEVGTIFIAQPLDYEQTKRYKLYVLASDGKWEDYTAVVVNVVNKNDEAPVFSVNEYYGSVTEELDGSPVFVLQVTHLPQQYVFENNSRLVMLHFSYHMSWEKMQEGERVGGMLYMQAYISTD